jgi:hypothetical protein
MSSGYRRTLKCYDCGESHRNDNAVSLRTVHDRADSQRITHVPFCDRCMDRRKKEGRRSVEGDLAWEIKRS